MIAKPCHILPMSQVTVYGDGKGDTVHVVGDKLTRRESLAEVAHEQPFPDNIKNTRHLLSKKLFEYVLLCC